MIVGYLWDGVSVNVFLRFQPRDPRFDGRDLVPPLLVHRAGEVRDVHVLPERLDHGLRAPQLGKRRVLLSLLFVEIGKEEQHVDRPVGGQAFLLVRGLNPLTVLGRMAPAVLTALFTKSSAATLPVTMDSAERRLGVRPTVARFVLPVCTTVNMNGCAAFILVTSLFVMQNGGTPITFSTIVLWLLISVVSAVGNAGVPMGCYFLTLSLMSGVGAPIGVLAVILPFYTIIDMIETAENVWSDSCVCAMTDKDLRGETVSA